MRHNADYRGENPAKKLTRLTFWLLVQQLLGTKRFLVGPHLVLTSGEAGDVSVLLGMGVSIEKIVGVEWKPHEAIKAQLKFPGLRVYQQDVARYAQRGEHRFASAYLDFCCQSGDEAFQRVVTVAKNTMQPDSLIGCNFMVGREKGMRDVAMQYRKEVEQEIAKMKKARREDLEELSSFFSRAFLMESELAKRAKPLNMQLESRFFYSSRQKDWHGHPWCGQLAWVAPSLKRKRHEPTCYYFATDEKALRSYALDLETKTGQAALLLNIPRTSLAALKAHQSRGTYR